MKLEKKNPFSNSALVTGASTGLGYSITEMLVRNGWMVYAGVRSDHDAQKILANFSPNTVPVRLDVTRPDQIRLAQEIVENERGKNGLQGLINNAGIAVTGPMEFLSLEDIRLQLEVNFLGQVAVTQAFLPQIRLGNGRIINMSSISGRVAMPFFGPYAASKFAFEAFSDSLRIELKPWNIHVALIEPGAINTPIWEKSLEKTYERLEKLPQTAFNFYGKYIEEILDKASRTGAHGAPPENVSTAVLHALVSPSPKTRYLIGKRIYWAALFVKFAPDFLRDWVIARMTGIS